MGHYSNHDRSSNWLSMETSALLQIAIMFPEFQESGEWFDTAYGRVMHEVRYCFSDNGVHMEKTPIYHMVASIAFAQAIVLCDKNGMKRVYLRESGLISRTVTPQVWNSSQRTV